LSWESLLGSALSLSLSPLYTSSEQRILGEV